MPSLEHQTAPVKKSSFWQSGSSIKNVETPKESPKKTKNRMPAVSFIDTLTLKRKSTNLSLPTSPATPTDVIKLSTVNHCGIYMPPSPSDDDKFEHYFDSLSQQQQQDNFHIPCCNKKLIMCTERGSLFTPSTRL
ncbi:hypothetical protein HMPREF1544_00735 [Mucor circinelloides 1006PhL]|uniref:Uncharacterized protein n=1 Tax=Mucor circinelloides f. circinelloides (strain 1006PhL) TaxID=1220926 RepID=S2JVJ6_MUCC1|nr:hypothetical protein HMPREF1544_00735 [Mucor circinelloides 1006PhL]